MQKYGLFIRKCVLKKEIYQIDLEPFRDLQDLLSNATNNINQIAKRVNSTGVIYKDYINAMKEQIEHISKELWQIHSLLLNRTSEGDQFLWLLQKIYPIKSTLNLAIDYIVNEDKTDEQLLVSTHKCHESTAHTQFLRTRETQEQKEQFLQDISFNPFYREKLRLKLLTKQVWSCVKRYSKMSMNLSYLPTQIKGIFTIT